jgi:hypothetical protein
MQAPRFPDSVVDGRQSGGIPGPPFLPKSSSKYDRGIEQDQGPEPDSLGVTVMKTMGVNYDRTNTAFFSRPGLDEVQRQIADEVRRSASYIIDRQSDEGVLIIMRKVYLNSFGADLGTLTAAAAKEAAKNIIVNIKYRSIQKKMQDDSFVPLAYGTATTSSIRGTL